MKLFFVTSLLFIGLALAQVAAPRQAPLTEVELTALLATGSSTERLAWLARNRGINFVPDENFLKALKDDGADDALLAALKSAEVRRADASVKNPVAELDDLAALGPLHVAAQSSRNHFHAQEMEPEFRAAVAASPANAFVHLALGKIFMREGNRSGAIAEFRKALNLQPDLAEALANLGNALLIFHRKEGLERLKQAVALAPSDGQFHYYYAIALEMNRDQKAGADQRKIAAGLGYTRAFMSHHIGGEIMEGKIVSQRRPEYPGAAQASRYQGVVRLNVLIGKDGAVKDIAIISGDPTLCDAAMKAVWEWRYQPTLLNGQPVDVDTEVDVNFKL